MARDLSGRADLDEVCGDDERPGRGGTFQGSWPTADLIVVGMGKLGGRELNVSSDIDLVFLYDGSHEPRSATSAPGAA